MKSNLSLKIKGILPYILIIIGLFSSINTNNNPVPIIERIFKPINTGSAGTIQYAGLITILLVYYGFKNLYKKSKVELLNSTLKRIIITFIILSVFPSCWNYTLKLYKSYSKDLNSIYCYRDSMKLSATSIEGNKLKVTCILELENCGNDKQEFNIKLHVPDYFKEEFKESTLVGIDDNNNIKTFKLNGKERQRFEVVFVGDRTKSLKSFDGQANQFKFDLYDKDEEIEFTFNGGVASETL